MKIAIIDYGAGNVQSVQFALERLGYKGILTADADLIYSSDKVIFPGVGQASSAMNTIKEYGLDSVIPELKQPVLGICLGMQLLCQYSEEANTECLGIFDTAVMRFSEKVKIPQIGWNMVTDLKSDLFLGIADKQYMYFVHSYYVPVIPQSIATTYYDAVFASAIQKDNFYGVQFHPEKSGEAGACILNNFLNL
ncbi:imidazole glycerol phosphate synthase subunit HisH [Flavobacterium cerinum]|uniref:Imidazole glycerol phosphate synthase subunit HisH n=1 Tax=Flavobacterium cerinum TaxID=2502784 RepID=A0ABY5IPG6_9FLAO|nr:imidazole glycerol phosphate synthase subunit HisH [Flavobacterium cerinum]UUC44534.1 imidazole glycerol phosphate synthase subunit HisH [Flavobacterium cerinum]